MCEKFDNFVKKIITECGMTDAGVLGNSGSYDTSDVRTPTIIAPMQRRLKFKKKRQKRRTK